jgi:tetratricopeptide (TPR) repeat protein
MRPRFRACVVLSFFVLLLVAKPVPGQGGNSLQGRVILSDGTQPRQPVKVTLTFNGKRIHEKFTDLSGRFSFTALPRGTYQLTAEGDGLTFETTTVYAEVSAFGSAPQLFTQDIQLRPIRGKPARRAAVVDAFAQNVPKTAQQALESALTLIAEKKSELAVEKLKDAVRIFPDYFEAQFQLGTEYLKAGRLSEAITHLDRAREINPNDERPYQSFGLLLMQQKNYAVAAAVFSEAARLNPANPFNPAMQATALIQQAYSTPSSTDAGAVQETKRILSKAEAAVQQASSLSDGKVKPDHLTLAMLYEMKEDRSRAARELEEYLQENPTARNAESLRMIIKRLRSSSEKAPANPRHN